MRARINRGVAKSRNRNDSARRTKDFDKPHNQRYHGSAYGDR
jgi:hypothetical protein